MASGTERKPSSPIIKETAEIIQKRLPNLKEISVNAIQLGLYYTGVKLSTGHGGVAYTPVYEIPQSRCCVLAYGWMPDAGRLTKHAMPEFLNFAQDQNLLKSAIGVAALNALSHKVMENGYDGYEVIKKADTLDYIDVTGKDSVSIIGAFSPFIKRLQKITKKIFVLEKNPKAIQNVKLWPEDKGKKKIASSDIIICTGATIVNHTVERILEEAENAGHIVLIGPTASMVPDPFFKRGVTLMGGLWINKPDIMLKILSEGGSGGHLYKHCAEMITVKKN